MKNALILSALLTLGPVCFAQQTEKYPLGNYEELTDTKPHDGAEVWNKMTTPTCLSWGTTDIRYKKLNVPDIKKTTRWQGKAWKGERINAQAVLWTKEALDDVTVTVSELKSGSAVIPASAITTNFVRYVMTDELNKDRKGGCGHRDGQPHLRTAPPASYAVVPFPAVYALSCPLSVGHLRAVCTRP